MALRHGVSRTAQVIGVGYYSLQEHVAARDTTATRATPEAAYTLVEVPAALGAGGTPCVVEVEHADGAKLRIHVPTGATLDLLALVRAFREPR